MGLLLALIGIIASIFVPWITLGISVVLYFVIIFTKYPEPDNLVAAIFQAKAIHFCLNTMVFITSLVALAVRCFT